jgi:tripartite-type tricarboxylate transporter receptor subunit TctC
LPPDVAKDRVQILKNAFQETLKDSDFLVDAKKSNLNIDPVSGEELEKIIENLFRLEPALASRLNEVLR